MSFWAFHAFAVWHCAGLLPASQTPSGNSYMSHIYSLSHVHCPQPCHGSQETEVIISIWMIWDSQCCLKEVPYRIFLITFCKGNGCRLQRVTLRDEGTFSLLPQTSSSWKSCMWYTQLWKWVRTIRWFLGKALLWDFRRSVLASLPSMENAILKKQGSAQIVSLQ